MLDWFNLIESSPAYEEVDTVIRQSAELEHVNGHEAEAIAAEEN
jgi:hypothetical protein